MSGFPRSSGLNGTESGASVKLRPSRTVHESGGSSPLEYNRQWLVMVDLDVFVVTASIIEIHERSKVKAPVCLARAL